jgi:hypothetical protein
MALDDRGLQAFLAAANGERGAGLAGADDNRIESFGHKGTFQGCVNE